MDDDDDKEKKWRKYAATALLGDLTSIPLTGKSVNHLANLFTGERVFADSRSPSAVLSSYGALSLCAATGANISRTSKDLLTILFRDEEKEWKEKKKKSANPNQAGKNGRTCFSYSHSLTG